MFADETSSVPLWPDSDPRRVMETAQKALGMLENHALDWMCAGHFPMVPSNDPKQIRASRERMQGQFKQFSDAVEKQLAGHVEGLTVDELYEVFRKESSPAPYINFLMANQFPVFTTFMKLTLLNHLLLNEFPMRKEAWGRVRFFSLTAK
jgi:hypothetical protein